MVDDGSTDDTADRVRGMAGGYPVPLIYLHQENRKQGAARNLGVGRARGDWLVFLGDDTVPEADFLVEHLRARGGVEKGADRVVAIGYTPVGPGVSAGPGSWSTWGRRGGSSGSR